MRPIGGGGALLVARCQSGSLPLCSLQTLTRPIEALCLLWLSIGRRLSLPIESASFARSRQGQPGAILNRPGRTIEYDKGGPALLAGCGATERQRRAQLVEGTRKPPLLVATDGFARLLATNSSPPTRFGRPDPPEALIWLRRAWPNQIPARRSPLLQLSSLEGN